jgi:hypothetical protein
VSLLRLCVCESFSFSVCTGKVCVSLPLCRNRNASLCPHHQLLAVAAATPSHPAPRQCRTTPQHPLLPLSPGAETPRDVARLVCSTVLLLTPAVLRKWRSLAALHDPHPGEPTLWLAQAVLSRQL